MIRIASRFRGPPDSGNGGYSAGLLASQLSAAGGAPIEVTLRRPPPLEHDLLVARRPEHIELMDGEQLVAEARSAPLDVQLPAAVSFEHAEQLARHYIGYQRHHFPGCFVCGPERAPGDGLRIFPGAEHPGDVVAAPWVPDANLADQRGQLGVELMWAALDCVGYFAVAPSDYPVALLGRMTAEITSVAAAGERCVVLGWSLGREGRKLHAGTAVFGADGRCHGRARQTWISLTPAA